MVCVGCVTEVRLGRGRCAQEDRSFHLLSAADKWIIIIIIDNICIALFSDAHKLTALYNILQHFLSENKIIKGNNDHEMHIYVYTQQI